MITVSNGVKTYKSGREVSDLKTTAGRSEYKKRIWLMLMRQKGNCKLCGKYLALEDATFDHENSRGMNGSIREDRISINGKPINAAVCSWCNIAKASKRGYE